MSRLPGEDHSLFALLAGRASRRGADACLIRGGDPPVSYAEVFDGAARFAALLGARGVGPGDRVVVVAPKTPSFVMLYLAVLQVGGVFVPLNPAYTGTERDYFIGDAEPVLVVDDAEALFAEAQALPPMTASVPRAPGDPAAILYTSGTTGKSKGAVLSQANLIANTVALTRLWGFGENDVLLHALPVFHVHGLFVALHCALLAGCPMLWLAKFEDDAVLAALPRATVMMGVPTFYTRLLANPAFTHTHAAHMRLFISGSAPLLEASFRAFEARTGHRIVERYGMSEALIITSNPVDGERVPGSVGFALPDTQVRVAGGDVIEVRGPGVFGGYWRMPERTAQEFTADGWFITGDIGSLDADGRLRISGRAKDLIISGGFNIYPREVELALDELPGVGESAVIGVAHPDLGEGVVAVIEGDADPAAVIAAMRGRLASFKLPKRVFAVAELPRNAMGKVQKNVLRERYADTFIT